MAAWTMPLSDQLHYRFGLSSLCGSSSAPELALTVAAFSMWFGDLTGLVLFKFNVAMLEDLEIACE